MGIKIKIISDNQKNRLFGDFFDIIIIKKQYKRGIIIKVGINRSGLDCYFTKMNII